MGSEFLTPRNSEELSLIVRAYTEMRSEFLTPDNLRQLSIIGPVHAEIGSVFLTLDKSEELSFIVCIQKWVQNFCPLIIYGNWPL